jgi:hypothetical protein
MTTKTARNIKGKVTGTKLNYSDRLGELGEIKIVHVLDYKDINYEQWKEMISERHYLKSHKLYGQQIKYLVQSPIYGWIGALSFGSASWSLKERDERLGWDEEKRIKELPKLVCNNRFYLMPEYTVPNLASKVLSKSLKRLTCDWERIYGVSPVLVETFVDKERFSGGCYKASNWEFLGQTQGRGRDDRFHKKSLSKKYIFVYELKKGILGPPLEKEEANKDWVSEEFRYAEMPNKARKKRLISLARDFYNNPSGMIPECCEGEAKVKGAYRFFSDTKIKPDAILSSHIQQTIERSKSEKVVLSVNDTTSFNLSNHSRTNGLGSLSSSQGELGYLLHDTVLFTTKGVPLGVLDSQTWSREVDAHGKSKQRRNKPIEEKESIKWLKSLRAMSEAQKKAPLVKYVSVGDRESDIHELFEEAEELEVNFLVRSCQNRRTSQAIKVWDLVENSKPAGIMDVRLKDGREVKLVIRFQEVTLLAPRDNKSCKGDIKLYAISAKEVSSRGKESKLCWRLFTNIKVKCFEQACEMVEWYSLRFGIETYHMVLKSGRKSEDKRLESVERLERCLAIDMIIAWRLMYLTMHGRATPEVSSDFFFNQNELEVLKRLKYGDKYKTDVQLGLQDAVSTIALLGGFISGKNRVPGVKVMWRGLRRLEDMTLGVLLIKGSFSEKRLRDFNFEFG